MSVAVAARVRKILVSLVLLLLPAIAFAQSGVWGARGISRQFLVHGTQLVAVDGRGLAIYDISDPANVRRQAALQRDHETLSAAFIGPNELAVLTRVSLERYTLAADGTLTLTSELPLKDYRFIAGDASHLAGVSANGVTIWRPDGEGLVALAQYVPNGTVNDVAFHGRYAYIAVDAVAIFVYDPAGGASPVAVIPVSAKSLAFSGDTLYAAAGVNGLAVIDAHDDANPVVRDRIGSGESNLKLVAASGSRVYAAEGTHTVRVYDGVRQTAVLDEPVSVLAANGTTMFVSGSIVDSHNLQQETGAPLRAFNASELASPVFASEVRDLAGPVSGVATNGSVAYVVDPPYFRTIDISRSNAPRELASIRIEGIQDRVRVSGNTAVIYGRGDVQVIDVSNPFAPQLTATFHSNGIPPSNAAIAGTNLVEGNPASGFHVVDFRSYAPPAQIGGIKGHYWDVLADNDTAYIFEQVGVRVIDMTNRTDVKDVKDIPLAGTQGTLVGATESHPQLLMVYGPAGLHLFTLANPLDPIAAAALPFPAGGTFAAAGDTAWFASNAGVTAIDLSDPSHPTISATNMVATSPMQMASAAGKVVIADRYSLRIYGPDTVAPQPPPPVKRRVATRR